MNKVHSYGIYIGRFQPFHTAHLTTVRFAFKHCEKLVIVVGSDNGARTIKNPWSSAERIAMISACLTPEELDRVIFVPTRDYLYNDNLWITAMQRSIGEATEGSKDIVLIGHKKDSSSFYLKLFPQWEFIETGISMPVDATKVRDLLFSLDKIGLKHFVADPVYEMLVNYMETDEFKRLHEEYHHIMEYKAAWNGAPFPPTFNTVDAVVICSGHVLVVRRKGAPGKGLLALPGGFIHHDEGLIDACVRELKEETAIKLSTAELKKHIDREKTFGHPNRSLRGRTITHAFCINLGAGDLPAVKGMDDADKAFWLPFRDIFSREDEFFDDHYHIITFFVSRF